MYTRSVVVTAGSARIAGQLVSGRPLLNLSVLFWINVWVPFWWSIFASVCVYGAGGGGGGGRFWRQGYNSSIYFVRYTGGISDLASYKFLVLLFVLSPFLTGRMFVRPNILRTLRRTMIRFLIELLVRRIWFGQSKLYFILKWLVMRCKLRPELAADAQ